MSEPSPRKYWAFISYSHRDKAWGDWLHRGLETYRVPKTLIGRNTERGETVPARAFPVFRDREEMPTAVNLGEVINRALEQSRYLIVICSPNSARSQWVNQEIVNFKKLGGEHRVLAIIVAGEPNAAEGKAGFTADDECFPPALKFLLGADGNLSENRTEPIAADARPHADGKPNALIKLLAGVLGVNYDDLRQREAARQRQRQRVLLATVGTLSLVFGALALIALLQRNEARSQQQRADINATEARHQRTEAVTQRNLAESHLSEALHQQGRDLLNRSRAAFSALRPTEAHRLITSALQGLSLTDGGTRPFFPPDAVEQKAALLLEKTTRGFLSYQQTREPFEVFFTSFAHDASDRRFYGGQDHEVRAYALADHQLLWTTKLDQDKIEWLSLTADRSAVLVASSKSLTLLEARTGKLLRTTALEKKCGMLLGGTLDRVVYRLGPNQLLCVETTPGRTLVQKTFLKKLLTCELTRDGRSVLALDSAGDLLKIDVETLEHQVLGKVDFPGAGAADFSPDGKSLAVTGEDGAVALFTTQDCKRQQSWPAQKLPVKPGILECHDSGEVYGCDANGWLERFNGAGRVALQHVPARFIPLLGVDAPNDQVLMIAIVRGSKTNVWLASLDGSHTNFAPFGAPVQAPLGAARCSHPTGLAVFSDDFGKIRAHMLPTSQVLDVADLAGEDYLADLVCSVDGLKLAVLSSHGVLRQYRLDGDHPPLVMSLPHGEGQRSQLLPANRLSYTDDGATLHALTMQGLIEVDTVKGTHQVILPQADILQVTMIARGASADRLYLGTQPQLLIYNLKTRGYEQSLSYPGVQYFTDVLFDADFVYVAAHRDGQGALLILRRQDHSLVAELNGFKNYASSLLRMADGRIALCGEKDVVVWNLASLRRQQHQTPPGETEASGPYSPAPGGWLLMPDFKQGYTVSEIDPLTGRVLRKLDHDRPSEPGPQFMHREFAGQHAKVLALNELPDRVHLFDRASFAHLASFTIGADVDEMVLAHQASWLAVLGENGECRSYDFTGRLIWTLPAPVEKKHAPWRIDGSADDRLIALQQANSQPALLFESATGKPAGELPVIAGVELGRRFWAGRVQGEGLTVWRAADRSKVWSSKDHGVAYAGCILAEAENLLIAWDDSGILHYLDLATGQRLFSDARFPLRSMEQRSGMIGGPDDGLLILNHALGQFYWLQRFGKKPPAWFVSGGPAPSQKGAKTAVP